MILTIYLVGVLFMFLALAIPFTIIEKKKEVVDYIAMFILSLLSWLLFVVAIAYIVRTDIKIKKKYAERLEDWKREREEKEMLQ